MQLPKIVSRRANARLNKLKLNVMKKYFLDLFQVLAVVALFFILICITL